MVPGDFAVIKSGVAYLALCTGAPIVPVACLGTRMPLVVAVGSVPPVWSRVDVVFGPPLQVAATPWPRRKGRRTRAGTLASEVARVRHVRHACETTGRSCRGSAARAEARTRTGGRRRARTRT